MSVSVSATDGPTPARPVRARRGRGRGRAASLVSEANETLATSSQIAPSTTGTREPAPAASEARGSVVHASSQATATESKPNASRVAAWTQRRARVRTENAHRTWLERTYHFKYGQAKRLILCWTALGFLEEGRFLGWARRGGMFEGGGEGEDGDSDGDGEVE